MLPDSLRGVTHARVTDPPCHCGRITVTLASKARVAPIILLDFVSPRRQSPAMPPKAGSKKTSASQPSQGRRASQSQRARQPAEDESEQEAEFNEGEEGEDGEGELDHGVWWQQS